MRSEDTGGGAPPSATVISALVCGAASAAKAEEMSIWTPITYNNVFLRRQESRDFCICGNDRLDYLIFASVNSTCLRTTGSYLRSLIFSVLVLGFFFAT